MASWELARAASTTPVRVASDEGRVAKARDVSAPLPEVAADVAEAWSGLAMRPGGARLGARSSAPEP